MTRVFEHNGARRLTHNQHCAIQDLPTFEALAEFYPEMPEHERKLFELCALITAL